MARITCEEKKYWLSKAGLDRIRYHRAIDGRSEEWSATELIGMAYSTLREWKKGEKALSAALKTDRRAEIARAYEQLDRSANGGTIAGKVQTKYHYEYDEDGNEILKSKDVIVLEEKTAPNPTAVIFKLKNIDAEHFKDRIENTLTGADGGAIQVQTMKDEDIDKRIAELEAKLKQ